MNNYRIYGSGLVHETSFYHRRYALNFNIQGLFYAELQNIYLCLWFNYIWQA
jgi:hypothetical protein